MRRKNPQLCSFLILKEFISKLNTAASKILGEKKGWEFMKPIWAAVSRQFVRSAANGKQYVHVGIKGGKLFF